MLITKPTTTMDALETISRVDEMVDRWLKPILKLLLTIPDYATYPGFPAASDVWVTSQGSTLTELTGFIGYLDVETTGLSQQDRATSAVGIGWLDGAVQTVLINLSRPGLLAISNSVVANWNQPYDRQYYQIPHGRDTNTHIDLMGLCMAVRGKPEKAEWKLPHLQTWERFCHRGMSLKEVLWGTFGEDLDKGVRAEIVKGAALPEDILEYCFRDTLATVKVGKHVLREYLQHTPSLISLMGHIMRHSFVLPFSDKFQGYWERTEEWFQGVLAYKNARVQDLIWESLVPCCPQHESIHKNYPERFQPRYLNGWLQFMGHVVYTKATKKHAPRPKQPKFNYRIQLDLIGLAYLVSTSIVLDTFLPKYLWELLGKDFHPATRLFGLVIPLEWTGKPVTYDRAGKVWYAGDTVMENLGDRGKSLSSPLSKEYLKLWEEGLTSPHMDPEFIKAIKDTIRWGMFRDRMAALESRDGWLVPLYSPTGTLSQRATDKVTLLVGSPKPDQGGSEFMSFIEAKPGYRIVQADLDSAELVLAGLVACHVAGIITEDAHPFSRANLLGEKKSGTDTHSIIAKQIGITRDGAKTRVYAGIYGEGMAARVAGIERQTGCTYEEAKTLAEAFTNSFVHGLAKDFFTGINMMAEERLPTRLLSRSMPLAYQHSGRDLVTSIRNHHIQSLGVDWLDSIQTLVLFGCLERGIDATLILTRHDELVYHVKDTQTEEFTAVLQTAHRIAKWAICHQFGVTQPNERWSEFSGVDIGDRYRKEPDAPISTITTQF